MSTFKDLNLQKNTDIVKTFTFNGQVVTIKQYLPLKEKLELITKIVNQSIDDELGYCNPCRIKVVYQLNLLFAYTDIEFTDEDKEDTYILYDLVNGQEDVDLQQNLCDAVFSVIPESEIDFINTGVTDTIKAYFKHQDSALGIMETLQTNYKNLNFDTTEITEKLSNPDTLGLVKDIVTKLE